MSKSIYKLTRQFRRTTDLSLSHFPLDRLPRYVIQVLSTHLPPAGWLSMRLVCKALCWAEEDFQICERSAELILRKLDAALFSSWLGKPRHLAFVGLPRQRLWKMSTTFALPIEALLEYLWRKHDVGVATCTLTYWQGNDKHERAEFCTDGHELAQHISDSSQIYRSGDLVSYDSFVARNTDKLVYKSDEAQVGFHVRVQCDAFTVDFCNAYSPILRDAMHDIDAWIIERPRDSTTEFYVGRHLQQTHQLNLRRNRHHHLVLLQHELRWTYGTLC